jgi:flagellar M-ring protein FliF
MDFSRREQTEEKYDPQSVVRSSVKNQEQSRPTAAAAPAAGVPGTKSNSAEPAPVFIPVGGQSAGADYSKQSETTNYEVSKVVRRTLEPTATVQKLSVAVIVDDAVQPGKPGDATAARKTTPRSPEDLKKIKDLVTAAVGIDTMRGDLLTVENIAFEAPPEVDDAPSGIVPELKTLTRPALRYTAFLVLFLMAYLLLYRPLSKRIFVSVDETLANRSASSAEIGGAGTMSLATPKTVKELEAAMAEGHSMPQVTAADVNKTDILKQRIAEFVQRDPEKGAQLVRSWLIEEGKS